MKIRARANRLAAIDEQARDRVLPRQPFDLAGGRDHFGRRRLAGGQRRGQRIAAGQRRGDGERRGGPLRRVGIEAAADDLLDGGIDVGGDGRHARQVRRFLQVDQLLQRLGVVGPLAGEEFVEHQAERVDVAAWR